MACLLAWPALARKKGKKFIIIFVFCLLSITNPNSFVRSFAHFLNIIIFATNVISFGKLNMRSEEVENNETTNEEAKQRDYQNKEITLAKQNKYS